MMSNNDELMMSDDKAHTKPHKPLFSTAYKNRSKTYMDKVQDGMMEASPNLVSRGKH
jgi:hypothetical protein